MVRTLVSHPFGTGKWPTEPPDLRGRLRDSILARFRAASIVSGCRAGIVVRICDKPLGGWKLFCKTFIFRHPNRLCAVLPDFPAETAPRVPSLYLKCWKAVRNGDFNAAHPHSGGRALSNATLRGAQKLHEPWILTPRILWLAVLDLTLHKGFGFHLQIDLGVHVGRADRRLCEEVHYNLVYRWFCRLSLDDEVPDHSSLSRDRRQSGIHEIKSLSLPDIGGDLMLADAQAALPDTVNVPNVPANWAGKPAHNVVERVQKLLADFLPGKSLMLEISEDIPICEWQTFIPAVMRAMRPRS
jgi:hypothetical protein